MPTFKENLAQLPSILKIDRLELYAPNQDKPYAVVENKPGTQGSLAVYNALFKEFGIINAHAARRGLELFAEHSEYAQSHPGSHPNIDRLFDIIAKNLSLEVKTFNFGK